MSTVENKDAKAPVEAGERRGRNTFGQKGGDKRKRGPKRGPRKDDSGSWVPTTKLGRLVKEGKVKIIGGETPEEAGANLALKLREIKVL